MNSSIVTIASLQLRAHERDEFPKVWPQIVAEVRRIAACGAELIVLPEGTVPAYVLGEDPVDGTQSEFALAAIMAVARETGTVIVFGAARCEGESVYNSAFVVDADGTLAGTADKQFLWHFDRQWFARGEIIEPIDTSIGRLGVLICADGRIPTISRRLVDRGAQILVMPTAWVTSGRDPSDLENVQADLLASMRARENGVPFVVANKCGVERGCVAYCGKSQIIDASGEVLSAGGQFEAQSLIAEVALEPARSPRAPLCEIATVTPVSMQSRIAITPYELSVSIEEDLRILETTYLVGADTLGAQSSIETAIPTLRANDAIVLDPGGLAAYKQAGYQLVIWQTSYDCEWQTRIARARAVELRLFLIVIHLGHAPRAYAIDPDGTIVAGTYGEYRVASFSLDTARTSATLLAPGTDVLEGLARISSLKDRR
ncbi:MAG: carbon-nitrogen hydrolase family protein [Candidatus Baltobacteraceae bacterium]